MHQCLRIPEILKLICDEVESQDWDEVVLQGAPNITRNSQLFALAQTCSLFQEPALASLWETISSMHPIIKCAGRDHWVPKWSGSQHELHLTRPILPSDIAIMTKYASLVRHYIDNGYGELLNPNDWETLSRVFDGTVLFPGLRSIHFESEQLSYYTGLFGTKFLSSITFSPNFLKQPSILVDLSASMPGLTSVDLRWLALSPTAQQPLIAAISNWRDLSHLALPSITPEVFRALAHNSCLKYLRIHGLDSATDRFPLLPSMEPSGFPMLEKLKIGTEMTTYTTQLIDTFPPIRSLRKISLHLISTDSLSSSIQLLSEDNWLRLLQSIAKFPLKRLTIKEPTRNFILIDQADEGIGFLSNALFLSLAANFTMLTHLKFVKSGRYNIVDDDVKILTEALPLLEEFRLYDNPVAISWLDRTEIPKPLFSITIASLAFFARNCRSISFIALTLDAEGNKVPRKSPHQAYHLERVDLCGSLLDDIKLVARFLFDTFPNLRQISHDWREGAFGHFLDMQKSGAGAKN